MIAVICLVLAALISFWFACQLTQASRKERTKRELHAADRTIQAEFTSAKRAMNDAAGQSWRNLAG